MTHIFDIAICYIEYNI